MSDVVLHLTSGSETKILAGFRALADVAGAPTGATDAEPTVPEELLELATADPNAEALFSGWEKLRTSGAPGVDLAVHKALAVLVGWAGVAEPLARLGTAAATKAIKTCLRSLYRGLSARSHVQVKATLSLCAAMVNLGPGITREFCLGFDFTIKALSTMGAGRTNSKQKGKAAPPDRAGFADFMLKLLQHGDEAIVQKVGITHPLIGSLFIGIENDTPKLQKAILEMVRDKVVRSGLMRKNKLGVLSTKGLLQLARLYRCDVALPGGGSEEETVRTLVHDVLLEACCSPEFGICFAVKQAAATTADSLPIASSGEKPNNPMLLHFVTALGDAVEDPLMRDLIMKIMQACPDILPQYFKTIRLAMEPKLSLRWMSCSSFLGRILSLPPSTVLTTGVLSEPSNRLESTVPALVSGAALRHGLQSARPVVAHFSAQLLLIVLGRLRSTLNELGAIETARPKAGVDCRRLRAHLLEGAEKRLPDVQMLLTLRHKVFQGAMKGAELLQCAVLKVLTLYQEMLPELLVAARFDVAKLLPPLEEIAPASKRVKLAVVLALSACAGALRWWVRTKGSKLTPIGILLQLFVTESDPAVSAQITAVLESLLHATELFDHHMDEVRIWLQTLQLHPTTAPFLEKVLCKLMEDPYACMDAVNTIASELQLARVAPSRAAPPPYSPLITSLLDHLATVGGKSAGTAAEAMVAEGLSRVVRSQTNPDALLVTVARRFPVLPNLAKVLKPYITSWLKYADPAVQSLAKEVVKTVPAADRGSDEDEDTGEEDDEEHEEHAHAGTAATATAAADVFASASASAATTKIKKSKKRKLDDDSSAMHSTGLSPPSSRSNRSNAVVKTVAAAGYGFPERAWDASFGNKKDIVSSGSIFDTLTKVNAEQREGASPENSPLGQLSFDTLLDHCNQPGHFITPQVAVRLEQGLRALPTADLPAACRQLQLTIRGLISSMDSAQTHSATGGGRKHESSNSRSIHYHAVHGCFVLVRHALQLMLRKRSVAAMAALLASVLQHDVVDRHFFCKGLAQAGSLEAMVDFHCVHMINDGLSACAEARIQIPVADVLLARVVNLISDCCVRTRSSSKRKGAGVATSPKDGAAMHGFAIARAAARWFKPTDAQELVQILLNMPTEKLVAAASGSATAAAPKLTDVGELLMTLLGVRDAAVSRNVTASSFRKLLRLSQQLLCPAVDAAIAALLAVNVGFNDDGSLDRESGDGDDDGDGDDANTNVRAFAHLDFSILADESYVQFCAGAPTRTRDLILAKLIASNRHVLAAFEAVQVKSAGVGFEALPCSAAAYVHSLSQSRQSDDAWANYCLPFESSSQAATATSALALTALLTEGIGQCVARESEKVRGGGSAATSVAAAVTAPAFRLVRRLVCAGSLPCCKVKLTLLNMLLKVATQDLVMPCDVLGLGLSLLWRCSKERPGDEPHLLLRFLADMLAVAVDEGDKTSEDQESVDLPPSEFVLLVWKSTAALSVRLRTLPISVDCSQVAPFVLRFQQQVCERWLSYPSAVNAVNELVCSMCKVDKAPQPLATLYERIVDSPLFETSMVHGADVVETVELHALRTKDAGPASSTNGDGVAEVASLESHASFERTRVAVAQLLLTVAKTQPSVCTSEQLPRLLLVYNASLAPSDLTILSLLHVYEKHGCPLGEVAAVWGPGSMEMRKPTGAGGSLPSGSASAVLQSLDALDRRRVSYSIDHSAFVLPDDETVDVPTPLKLVHQLACYDHEYLLPLLAMLLSSKHGVDLRLFVEAGALSYLLVALSATAPKIRRMAYSMVGSILAKLEVSDMRERRQVVVALKALRDAIPEENMALTPCITAFVGRAVRIALHPENVPLYPIINRFLLQRPVLDLEDVPLFYNLFNSSSETSRTERMWLLRLLAAGFRRKSDYAVFRRRRVFDLLLNLCDSKLTDGRTSSLSVQVLVAAASSPDAAADLVRNRGLLAWVGTRVSEWSGSHVGSRGVQAFDGFVNVFSSLCRTLSAKSGLLQGDADVVWEEARKVLKLCIRGLVLEAERCQSDASMRTLRWDLASLLAAANDVAKFFGAAIVNSNEYFALAQTFFYLYGTSWGQRDWEAAASFRVAGGARLPPPAASNARAVRSALVALLPLVELKANIASGGGGGGSSDVRFPLIEWALENAFLAVDMFGDVVDESERGSLSSSSSLTAARPALILRWLRKSMLGDASFVLQFGKTIQDPGRMRNLLAFGLAATSACASRSIDALICLEELCVFFSYVLASTAKNGYFGGVTPDLLKHVIETLGPTVDIVIGTSADDASAAATAKSSNTSTRFTRAEKTSRLLRNLLVCEVRGLRT